MVKLVVSEGLTGVYGGRGVSPHPSLGVTWGVVKDALGGFSLFYRDANKHGMAVNYSYRLYEQK